MRFTTKPRKTVNDRRTSCRIVKRISSRKAISIRYAMAWLRIEKHVSLAVRVGLAAVLHQTNFWPIPEGHLRGKIEGQTAYGRRPLNGQNHVRRATLDAHSRCGDSANQKI
jgi:hypothetical protein